MERLTKPGHEYYSCDFMDDGVYIGMNRLREYEDTGLTPEQIIEMDKMYAELAKEVMQLRKGNTEKVPTENDGSDNHDRHGSY